MTMQMYIDGCVYVDVYVQLYIYHTHTCLERPVSCHERKCSVSADVDFPMFRLRTQIQPPYGLCETASWHFSQ